MKFYEPTSEATTLRSHVDPQSRQKPIGFVDLVNSYDPGRGPRDRHSSYDILKSGQIIPARQLFSPPATPVFPIVLGSFAEGSMIRVNVDASSEPMLA